MFVQQYGLVHVVDMDLSKCFDRLDHDLIVASIRRRVRDGSILSLLRMFLESGVMIGGNWKATEIESPQGWGLSPWMSNVYLDAFDREACSIVTERPKPATERRLKTSHF